MKWTRLTDLDMALLGLINAHPSSGYDLRKIFKTTPMGHYGDSPGSIYPALKKLADRGLIRGRIEGARSMRPRKTFTISPEGFKVFKNWLLQPVSPDDISKHNENLLLRFAFMGGVLHRSAIKGFLQSMEDQIRTHVAGLEAFAKTMTGPGQAHGRMALEHGMRSLRTTEMWAQWARKQMDPKRKV